MALSACRAHCGTLLAICTLLQLSVAAAAPLKNGAAAKLLKAKLPGAKLHVSNVLADLGGGRFPVLFVVESKDCYDVALADGSKEKQCDDAASPHVAVVTASAVEGELELSKGGAQFKWGVTLIKDYDADSKPELALTYAFDGHNAAAVGAAAYKHLALVDLDAAPHLAFTTLLDDNGAQSGTQQETKWKFADGKLTLTRRQSMRGDDEHATTTTLLYAYDPKSTNWLEQNPH